MKQHLGVPNGTQIWVLVCMLITVGVFCTALNRTRKQAQRENQKEPLPTYYLKVNEMNTRIGDTIYYEFTSDKQIMTLGTLKKQDGEYLILIP